MYKVGFCQPGSQAIALTQSCVEPFARMLSGTFQNEARFSYVVPDEEARRMVLPWFFRSVAIPACRTRGEIYATENLANGALWIRPGEITTFRQVLQSEILAAPFNLGSASIRRALKLFSRIEEVHERMVRGPHWYLWAQIGLAADVVKPVLLRADSEGHACYVEVFDERNLPFYISLGFRFYGAGRVPGGGPNFWSMSRPPQKQIKM
jgi:hypothetical protein